MSEDRLPRIIYSWDRSLNTNAWAQSLNFVLQYANMLNEDEESELSYIDVSVLEARLLRLEREKWWAAAVEMPKLRAYKEIYDDHDNWVWCMPT